METPPEKLSERQADTPKEQEGIQIESKEVTFEEFEKLDFRIGKILEVAPVPKSKKLMQIIVDFGDEKKQAVAGLLQYYNSEELVGKKCVFLVNLKRRTIAGLESQCMILAAEDKEGKISVLFPEKDISEGAKIG